MQPGVDGGDDGRNIVGLGTMRRSATVAGDDGKDEKNKGKNIAKISLEFGSGRSAGLRGAGGGVWWPAEARRAAPEWIRPSGAECGRE